MLKKILLKLFFLLMNDISTTRYVIIIFGQDTLLIIVTINHCNLNRICGKYIVVEKEGFGAI